MRQIGIGGIILLGLGVIYTPNVMAAEKNVIAKINGTVITVDELKQRLGSFPKEYSDMLNTRENKVKVLNQMIDETVLLEEAKNHGYEKTDEYKAQVEAQKTRLLISFLLRDTVEKKLKVNDEDLKTYYSAHPEQFKELEQRRVRHILVKTEEEAKQVMKALKKGDDFIELARKKSVDPSAANGGDLGWFTKGQLVPEFEAAAFALKSRDDLSEIVKTQFGYHIIKLVDTNVRQKLEFNEVKDQINRAVTAEKQKKEMDKYLEQLKEKAKISKDISQIK